MPNIITKTLQSISTDEYALDVPVNSYERTFDAHSANWWVERQAKRLGITPATVISAVSERHWKLEEIEMLEPETASKLKRSARY